MRLRIFIITGALILSACTTVPSKNLETVGAEDRVLIQRIYKIFDRQMNGSDDYIAYLDEDVVLMANNEPVIEGKDAYISHIQKNRSYGSTEIEHQIVDLQSYPSVVIVRGRAIGRFTGNGAQESVSFATKNLFIFKRDLNGSLKVSQIIFNLDPG